MSPFLLLGLFAAGFGAGFVDSIAGGGGLITVPVLLATGMAPADALATNKLQATFGSGSAAWHYRKARLVGWSEAWPGVVSTAFGATAGVVAVTALSPQLMRRVMPFLLAVAAWIVWRRPSLGTEARPARLPITGFLVGAGLALGFYDGFFGPGTGTFWTLALVLALGFPLIKATAWTKWMNFTSNIVSLIAFAFAAHLNWAAGLVMGAGQWLGARAGTGVALRGGAKVIRPVFLSVVVVATAKLFYDGWLR